jgi:hypothetical protein
MGLSARRTWATLAAASVIALLLLGAAATASAQTPPRELIVFEPA